MYKVIAFDFIGVLYANGHINHEFTIPFLGLSENDHARVSEQYIRYKKGLINKDDFWQGLGGDSTREGEFLALVKKSFNTDFLKIIDELDKGYQIVAITDLPDSWGVYLANINENFTFDYTAISAVSGIRKNGGTGMFDEVIQKMGVKGEEIIFVDDKLENLEQAAKVGIATVWMKLEDQESDYAPDYQINKLTEIIDIIKK